MSDIKKTVGNGEEGPSEDRYQTGPSGNPVGCAIFHRYCCLISLAPGGTPPDALRRVRTAARTATSGPRSGIPV